MHGDPVNIGGQDLGGIDRPSPGKHIDEVEITPNIKAMAIPMTFRMRMPVLTAWIADLFFIITVVLL